MLIGRVTMSACLEGNKARAPHGRLDARGHRQLKMLLRRRREGAM